MFQLTLPAGLEEYVSLETDQLIFEESAKSLAQFKIVGHSMNTKDNNTILQANTS